MNCSDSNKSHVISGGPERFKSILEASKQRGDGIDASLEDHLEHI